MLLFRHGDLAILVMTCNTSCPSNCERDICYQTSGLCTVCEPGYYGVTCNTSCPSNCKGTICNQTSGLCTVCEAGFYGNQCLKSCGSCQGVSCDKDTGDCTTGCTDGWTGNECDNKAVLITNGDSTVGIGVGSGVVILVLVIVIIVLVRRLTMKRGDTTGSSHMTDISLSRTAKELKQNQDNTYDEIATCNKEQTIAQISHNEANYEQLGRREVEIPNIYETTDVDKET
ncbi:multiple epidermal growth factor-like domains protein 10 isoform X2 [Mizuhopecten yessoensis]|uniref:multiple epidermal growth factor-like domains protein 10 isoform X2 n=1 Tax=Mizuhopecten yessoensis TaxID=6573 RepID=UPI000B45AAB9|nr:multiple epidermal growth factor-like domains protein 10 isoform X2 [Mizuhopecten yessoensis]